MKIFKSLLLSTTISLALCSQVMADVVDDTLNFNNNEVNGYSSIATTDDSTSMVVNPGGIGLKGDGEVFFSNSIYSDLSQTNIFGTYSNFNLGYQSFTPRGKTLNPIRKLIVGTGYPIIEGLSLGVTYFNVQSTDTSNLNTNTFDIGLLARPTDFLSVGLVGRNIFTPAWGQSPIRRSYLAALGFRPGAWDRLTLTLDGEWVEGSPINRIKGVFGLESEFINGVVFKAKASSDATFKNISFVGELALNFPYVSIGYDRIFNNAGSRDAGAIKLSLNKSRTIFEAGNSELSELSFNGNIQANKDAVTSFLGVNSRSSVYDYIQEIDQLKKDKSIAGIVLNFNNFSSGLAVNEEIRSKLEDFKKSGKKVIAYIRSMDMKQYYLASVADYIVMHPIGDLQFQGIGSVHYFYKDLMDTIGIEAQYERIGKYKSAVEPMIQNKASDADKEQTNALLQDFYNNMSQAISTSRKISQVDIKGIVDHQTFVNSNDAKDLKLVDKIANYDEMGKIVANLMNKEEKLPIITYPITYKKYNWRDEDQIAIINASGTVIEGSSTRDLLSGETTMGADTIADMLSKSRKNESVKAVVLRLDSGGGSALASDIILREISRYKEAKKPIVISMSNVAASGAYWLSSDATKIVSDANTITGSIGVFSGKMNFSKLFEKLGLNVETFKIGEHADAFSEARPFTDDERKMLFNSIQATYRTFLERVATGRGLSVARVDEIGQGHVYSGTKAKELKLVDEIGGLEKAIEVAKNLAMLKDKKVELFNVASNTGMNTLSQLATDPKQAFYPFVMLKLIRENKVLAIMPNY